MGYKFVVLLYVLLHCLILNAEVGFAQRSKKLIGTSAKEIVLSGNIILTKSIIINENTRVISSSRNKAKISTKGDFPAFIIRAKSVHFEGLEFDGLSFIQINTSMDNLKILACKVTDTKKTERAYLLTKSNAPINIKNLYLSNNNVSSVTPILLSKLYVEELIINNNYFSNIYRYGIRVLNDAHNGESVSVGKFTFENNKVDILTSGKNKTGPARLIMTSASDGVFINNNVVKNILGYRGGGNILYISGTGELSVTNNLFENLNGATFAIHDKGLTGNSKKIISKNIFRQNNTSKIGAILNIYQSSNYTIESNTFENLTSPALRISNPTPQKNKPNASNIVVSNNTFLRTNNAEIITVIQTVQNLIIRNNVVDGFFNKLNIPAGHEIKPRFLSLLVTLSSANIDNVILENNIIKNVADNFSLIWTSQLKDGILRNVILRSNSMDNGEALVRSRNKLNSFITLDKNNISNRTKDIVGGSNMMIRK